MMKFKVLLMAAFFPIGAFAGAMGDISFLAIEAAKTELGVSNNEASNLIRQDFTQAEEGAQFATVTVLEISLLPNQKQEWTCVSQFAKTPEFFQVIKTKCHN